MRFVAMLTPGPAWNTGRSVYEQGPPIQRHLEFMRARYDAGDLLLGGPFVSGNRGMAVFEAADESSAVEMVEGDPAVQAGVLVYELTEMLAYFDVFDGVRTSVTVGARCGEGCAQPLRIGAAPFFRRRIIGDGGLAFRIFC